MVTSILGGIGLFLLGMVLMTDGLKAVAGDALRRILQRFTGGTFSSLATGAGVTALVQSSSATTLTTIGFVSAGLLTFPQAVGVIFGANIGTTSTSWLVSLLGLKFSIAKVALPLVGVGALMRLLGRGRLASVGLALAGFGLIFIGIDTLQVGMSHLAERIDPSSFPESTILGRLALVGVGAVMTVLMQSSSAAAATTLTALSTGTIDLHQAAALVIGQNVGTTVTAGFAAIGASVAARRTALAHVLFNLITGLTAFLILPLFVQLTDRLANSFSGGDDTITLAAFHTAFNLLGVLILLPFMRQFSEQVQRVLPDRGPALTRHLDPTVAKLPAVALETSFQVLRDVAGVAISTVTEVLQGRPPPEEPTAAAQRALHDLRLFLSRVKTDTDMTTEHQRHLAALHVVDHLERLLGAAREHEHSKVMREDRETSNLGGDLAQALAELAPWLRDGRGAALPQRLSHISSDIAEKRRGQRRHIMERTAEGLVNPDQALHRLEAMRWVDRMAYHSWRMAHHLAGGEGAAEESDTYPGIDHARSA